MSLFIVVSFVLHLFILTQWSKNDEGLVKCRCSCNLKNKSGSFHKNMSASKLLQFILGIAWNINTFIEIFLHALLM